MHTISSKRLPRGGPALNPLLLTGGRAFKELLLLPFLTSLRQDANIY